MTVKIGETDISKYITPPNIADTYRAQSVAQTLNGSLVVDRIGGTKKRITVMFPLLPLAKWEEIKALILPISFSVSVDSAAYTMHLDGEIPTPIKFAAGDDVMCGEISLTFEEM